MEIEACDVRLGEDCIAKVYQGEELKWSRQNDLRDAYSGLVFTALEDGVEITVDVCKDVDLYSITTSRDWNQDIVADCCNRRAITYSLNAGEQIGLKSNMFIRARVNYKYHGSGTWRWEDYSIQHKSFFSDNGKLYRADGFINSLIGFKNNFNPYIDETDRYNKVYIWDSFESAFSGCIGLVSSPMLSSKVNSRVYYCTFNGCHNLREVHMYNNSGSESSNFQYNFKWYDTLNWNREINNYPSITYGWLGGVNNEGIIYTDTDINLLNDSYSGVPTLWNLVVDNQ